MIDYSVTWSRAGAHRDRPTPPDPLRSGLAAHRKGDLEAAIGHYLAALRARPNRPLAAYQLGLAHIDRGMGLASIPFLTRAALLRPDAVPFAEARLYAMLRSGRLDACEALLAEHARRGLPLRAEQWRAWLAGCRQGEHPQALGVTPPGMLEDADEGPDPVLELPTATPLQSVLREPFVQAVADHEAGRASKLIADLGPLLARYPDWGEGQHLYGLALMALGRLDAALAALRCATRLLPGRSEIWDHLGIALGRLDDIAGTGEAYEQSLALDPLRAENWNNAADAAIRQERVDEGYQYAFLAVRLNPDLEAGVLNLGRAARALGDLGLARRAFSLLLKGNPNHLAAERHLGELCLDSGDYDEALARLDRASVLDPHDWEIQSSLLFLHSYLATETQAGIHARARRCAALLSASRPPLSHWPNQPDPGRRLRIGVVSGDLCRHPVGFFFAAVAEALAASPALELCAYPTTRRADGVTERIRAACDHWTVIAGLDDADACQRIRADGIDLLVDLSGHTGKHRLGVFAHKPAPVQATWLGYFATTGLSQIDYLIAGPWDVPVAEECEFSERIWRLPATRLCFSRPAAEVTVAPLPAARDGRITFGCFNNLKKLNERVIRLWARILTESEGSRLFLKSHRLDTAQVRDNLTERFRAAGLDPERLILEGPSRYEDYLAAYARVDIALDPFPYTGGTTSIESLWMGVPVLTLAGDRLLARQGESMLRALGLDDWIAADEADYLARAVRLAAAPGELEPLRAGLRARLEASPLMDAPRFASDLEQAFRGMWTHWCEQQGDGADRPG